MSASSTTDQASAGDSARERRTFLRQLALFGAVFLLVHTGCHVGYRALVDVAGMNGRIDRDFRSLAPTIRVLALGDSHVQAAFVAQDIDGAFNFAAAGESWIHTDAKLRAVLPTLDALEQVILPFDPHAFSAFDLAGTVDPAYWDRYLDFGALAEQLEQPALLGDGVRGAVASYVGRGSLAMRAIRDRVFGDLAPVHRGYVPDDTDLSTASAGDLAAAASNRIAHHFSRGAERSSALIDAFEAVLERLDDRGVQVVLVSYPLTAEYRAGIPVEILEWMPGYAAEQASRYGVVADWWDASALFDGRPGYFRDTDHLNHRGAERFTARLAEVVGRPPDDASEE